MERNFKIKLGTRLGTADYFRRFLKNGGFRIEAWANDILGMPDFAKSISSKPVEVELCTATTAELTGKNEGGTTAEAFVGIRRIGGELCPAEVGPQMRLQYRDQPNRERLLIAMEPIIDSDGYPMVFVVERHIGGLLLGSSGGRADVFYGGDYQWVFVRPK